MLQSTGRKQRVIYKQLPIPFAEQPISPGAGTFVLLGGELYRPAIRIALSMLWLGLLGFRNNRDV